MPRGYAIKDHPEMYGKPDKKEKRLEPKVKATLQYCVIGRQPMQTGVNKAAFQAGDMRIDKWVCSGNRTWFTDPEEAVKHAKDLLAQNMRKGSPVTELLVVRLDKVVKIVDPRFEVEKVS